MVVDSQLMDDVALSVSISPLLPSAGDEDDLLVPKHVHFQALGAFQPTHTVFTPKLTDTATLRYRRPDDRLVGSTSLAPPTSVSSIVHPNYDDFLRRVSVVLYQHVRRCEKRFREQQRAGTTVSMPASTGISTASSIASHASASGSGLTSASSSLVHASKSAATIGAAPPAMPSRLLASVEEEPSSAIGNGHAHNSAHITTNGDVEGHGDGDVRAETPPPRSLTSSIGSSAAVDIPVDELFREKHFVTPQFKYTFVRVPRVHPLTCYVMDKVTSKCRVPTVDEIFRFCKNLFNKAQLSAECTIVCLIYIERLMEQANVPLLAETWKPIVLCGLLLASKVWQDLSSWNVEISNIYPQFPLHSINRLERLFLHHIQWDLYISASVYAKYYFALRSLTEKKDFRRRYNYTMRVDPPNSKRLEERSAAIRHELYSKSL